MPRIIFNHDGCSMVSQLIDTDMTEADVDRSLVAPVAERGVDTIDFSILSTANFNCRTRHGFEHILKSMYGTQTIQDRLHRVITHYNAQPNDLLDLVIKHGHARGLRVLGALRLNHWNNNDLLDRVPGRCFQEHHWRKDFRDPAFHDYLLEVLEDLLAKGVDGLTLDFERKAPFFPSEAPMDERADACTDFVRRARALSDRTLVARVCHDAEINAAQGQAPQRWINEGLLDAVVPATHNHEPDDLSWRCDRFLQTARAASHGCEVWPQIWPTPTRWRERAPQTIHNVEAVRRRVDDLLQQGADGVYFFNFCCEFDNTGDSSQSTFDHLPDVSGLAV